MNDTPQDAGNRLDSWKAIASYLDRDERTVQRWERELGLPVRRLPGRGRSVFAYPSEIDAWLKTTNRQEVTASATVDPADAPPASAAGSTTWRTAASAAAIAALAIVAVLAWRLRPAQASASELRLTATPDGVVAVDGRGARQWEYAFPAAYRTFLAEDMAVPAQIVGGPKPTIYVGTAFSARKTDDRLEGGAFAQLDLAGREVQSFTFSDEVTFNGTSYGPPWVITAFAINDDDVHGRRIAIAAHHAVWDASLLTVLDEQMHRHGTFVHAGWIEQVQWLAANRLVIGGYSNAHAGGMVALLDPTAPGGVDGQGPEPPGSPYHCDTCPSGEPLRMAVMPRTELNRLTASRFNRVKLRITPGGILARTIEVPQPAAGLDAIEALYDFTPALDLVRASFGEHYWEFYQSLESQRGRRRTRAESPDRNGPREILTWDRQSGWKTLDIH